MKYPPNTKDNTTSNNNKITLPLLYHLSLIQHIIRTLSNKR